MFHFRFVLVGDDYQLPPIVISSEAQSHGMDISLLRKLIEAHPESATCLTAQYRMNEQIMSICNTLIYENRMTCATSSVANARLILPQVQDTFPSHPFTASTVSYCPSIKADHQYQKDKDEIFNKNNHGKLPDNIVHDTDISPPLLTPYRIFDSKNYKLESWVLHCIDPLNSVVFLNTDSLYDNQSTMKGTLLKVGPNTTDNSSYLLSDHLNSNFKGRETEVSNNESLIGGTRIDSKMNFQHDSKEINIHEAEVNVVCQLVFGLMSAGFDVRKSKGLGVISPYRSQVRALKDSLSSLLEESDRSGLLGSECAVSNKIDSEERTCRSKVEDQRRKQTHRGGGGGGGGGGDGGGEGEENEEEGGGGGEKKNHGWNETTLECDVSTVDSFQGRDMDMIIFSTVKNKNTKGGSVSVSWLE